MTRLPPTASLNYWIIEELKQFSGRTGSDSTNLTLNASDSNSCRVGSPWGPVPHSIQFCLLIANAIGNHRVGRTDLATVTGCVRSSLKFARRPNANATAFTCKLIKIKSRADIASPFPKIYVNSTQWLSKLLLLIRTLSASVANVAKLL